MCFLGSLPLQKISACAQLIFLFWFLCIAGARLRVDKIKNRSSNIYFINTSPIICPLSKNFHFLGHPNFYILKNIFVKLKITVLIIDYTFDVLAVFPVDLQDHVIEDPVVEILSSQMGVTGNSFHLGVTVSIKSFA